MKKLFLIICFLFLAACSNNEASNKEDNELNNFVNSYNDAAETLKKNSDIIINELNHNEFGELEKTKDGFGYKQLLDEIRNEDTTALFRIEAYYDNDSNIIGYQTYSTGNLNNVYEDGTIEFSTPGIGSGYAIAQSLFGDIDNFSTNFLELMNEEKEELYYEENDYKISMTSKPDIGSLAFKFMKTK